MSFEYGQFQPPQQEGAPGQVPIAQDGAGQGQPTDPTGQQQMSFSPDGNGGAQGGPGGDQKTTLW